MAADVLGVHEFRATLPAILRQLAAGEASAVVVGAYRRPVAALVTMERFARLEPSPESSPESSPGSSPNLVAIRELLRLSPEQRLAGLANAAGFFAAASRA